MIKWRQRSEERMGWRRHVVLVICGGLWQVGNAHRCRKEGGVAEGGGQRFGLWAGQKRELPEIGGDG